MCVSLAYSQLDPGLSKHNETAQQYLTTCGKTVGVTGKYQNGNQKNKLQKSAFIVLSPKCQRFTDTEAQIDINRS